MKNLILSIIVVGLAIWGGYHFLKGAGTDASDADAYATSTLPYGDGGTAATSTATGETTTVTNNQTSHMITIDTNYGKITIETYDADAPNTVKNFITLAQKGFYNGLTFHRVIEGFMIQGGDPLGNGTGGPGYQFADELDPATASYKAGYKKGVVAMANAGPNTNGSQFFIMAADYPLPNNYTIFGHVVEGQDVVDKIDAVATDANDKPLSPVTMKTVTVQ
jgi:cyclophilin family peptidyl-prolyl cis-trans isomerase